MIYSLEDIGPQFCIHFFISTMPATYLAHIIIFRLIVLINCIDLTIKDKFCNSKKNREETQNSTGQSWFHCMEVKLKEDISNIKIF
jgi:hypothetical protein